MASLLDAVRRYAETHVDSTGLAQTPIPGLTTVRAVAPSGLVHAISRPLVCLVLQGSKHVTMGAQAFAFSAGDSLLITADVPTVSQITRASFDVPYLSLVLELDPAIIADLAGQMSAAPVADHSPVWVEPTDAEVSDAALRLMRLLDRPASVPVLHAQLLRELHYWLLAGRHGATIRRLVWPAGHAQSVARAVAVLRSDFARPLPVERLAAVAGMSPSSFHHHFRTVTSLAAAVSETVALDRGETADVGGGNNREQRGICCRLRECASLQPGVQSDVRLTARSGDREGEERDAGAGRKRKLPTVHPPRFAFPGALTCSIACFLRGPACNTERPAAAGTPYPLNNIFNPAEVSKNNQNGRIFGGNEQY